MSPRSKINSSGRVMGERQEVEFSRRTNGGMEVGLVEEQKQVERDEKSERERSKLRWVMFFQPIL